MFAYSLNSSRIKIKYGKKVIITLYCFCNALLHSSDNGKNELAMDVFYPMSDLYIPLWFSRQFLVL